MMATVTFSRLTFVKTQNSVFNGEEPSGLRLVWGKKIQWTFPDMSAVECGVSPNECAYIVKQWIFFFKNRPNGDFKVMEFYLNGLHDLVYVCLYLFWHLK